MDTDPLEELAELRLGLLSAELDKRLALRRLGERLDVEAVLEAFDRCNELSRAIFYQEAKIRTQELKDELLPPRQTHRRA